MGLNKRILQTGLLLAVTIITCSAGITASYGQGTSLTEVVLEGGPSLPLGDLGDNWVGTEKGLGAETGYTIGFRFRYFLTPQLSVSPAYHFDKFGDYNGVHDVSGAFEVRTYIHRFGLDLNYMPLRESDSLLQPWLTAGVALLNCHYEDEFLALDELPYEFSRNSLGASAGAGLRLGSVELGAVYNLARFETAGILGGGVKEDFSWDHFVIRAGLVFPTDR